jgi:hypothetical protein
MFVFVQATQRRLYTLSSRFIMAKSRMSDGDGEMIDRLRSAKLPLRVGSRLEIVDIYVGVKRKQSKKPYHLQGQSFRSRRRFDLTAKPPLRFRVEASFARSMNPRESARLISWRIRDSSPQQRERFVERLCKPAFIFFFDHRSVRRLVRTKPVD